MYSAPAAACRPRSCLGKLALFGGLDVHENIRDPVQLVLELGTDSRANHMRRNHGQYRVDFKVHADVRQLAPGLLEP